MVSYRLYCLDGAGKITASEWVDANSDDEAVVLARSKKLGLKCELWHGNCFIAKIEARSAG